MPIPKFGDKKFVVKEHLASSLHWDFRLEVFGDRALSHALKESPNLNPANLIRAARVADHSVASMMSERIILPGNPGAGPTAIWDRGLYRMIGKGTLLNQLVVGFIRFELLGERLKGNFSLKRIGQGDQWLWVKEKDSFVDLFNRFPNVLTPDKIHELEMKLHRRIYLRQMQLL
jgi:bifunctional non-homologous end joining protein LigD